MEPAPRIQWKTLEQLEASLLELGKAYAEQPGLRRQLREMVIRTKDRARFASKNPKVAEEKRALKQEMVQWMLVWLDDPSIFAGWAELRRTQLGRAAAEDGGHGEDDQ
ncbi:MAG TPA: hypothetical protein VGL72_02320 [Bryobacteraceae bacterium]|jgi:hypothetical protein